MGRPRVYPDWVRDKAKENGISMDLVRQRVSIGWSLEKAVNTPVSNKGHKKYPDWVYKKLKENKVPINAFHQRIYKGLSLEEACKPINLKTRGKYKTKKNYYWVLVTADKYELPLIVCDTAKELADYLNINLNTVYQGICKEYKNPISGRKIRKVKKID